MTPDPMLAQAIANLQALIDEMRSHISRSRPEMMAPMSSFVVDIDCWADKITTAIADLKEVPPAEPRLREALQSIASNPLCDDPGEDEKCGLDSGPYCSAHDYFIEDAVRVARAALKEP
jgi:hypothetical protein